MVSYIARDQLEPTQQKTCFLNPYHPSFMVHRWGAPGSLSPSNPHPTMNAIHHNNSSATMFHSVDLLENTCIHIMGNGSRKLSCRVSALVVSEFTIELLHTLQ
jgi:hypothetical protein